MACHKFRLRIRATSDTRARDQLNAIDIHFSFLSADVASKGGDFRFESDMSGGHANGRCLDILDSMHAPGVSGSCVTTWHCWSMQARQSRSSE